MRKIFTKKFKKRLLTAVLSAILIAILLGIFVLVYIHEIYKYRPCEEFSFNNGTFVEKRIKGMDSETKLYIEATALSCAQTNEKDKTSYEEKGAWTEKRSCKNDTDGKAYIVTSFRECPFGCFEGTCMSKCSNPEDNNFFKGAAYGIEASAIRFGSNTISADRHFDFCTESEGKENLLISKFLSERICDQNNYISSKLVQCENICYNGACKTNDFRYCENTDASDQGKIKGTVSYYDPTSKDQKTLSDSCQDTKIVEEYFCGADKLPHRLILTCRKSCVDGQCVQ